MQAGNQPGWPKIGIADEALRERIAGRAYETAQSHEPGTPVVIARCKPSPCVLIVAVAGALDLSSADELGAALNHPCDAIVQHIIVDLSWSRFDDSSGIHELAIVAEEVKARLGTLTLVLAPREPQDRFGIARLGSGVVIAESLESALRGLPGEATAPVLAPDGA